MPRAVNWREPDDPPLPRKDYVYVDLGHLGTCVQTYQNVYGVVVDWTGRFKAKLRNAKQDVYCTIFVTDPSTDTSTEQAVEKVDLRVFAASEELLPNLHKGDIIRVHRAKVCLTCPVHHTRLRHEFAERQT
eukprot:7207707-Pyramimonas_sp.AAC.1